MKGRRILYGIFYFQIRKLCRDCKKVLDYLAISEVIETMEDLVQFVKDLSPCLSKVSHDIDARSKDLLNPYQRDALQHHLEQVKTYICRTWSILKQYWLHITVGI